MATRRHLGDEQTAQQIVVVDPAGGGTTGSQIPGSSPNDQTVSVDQLRTDVAQGLFNNLDPPAIYQGEQAYTSAQADVAAGAGTGMIFDANGGGGGVSPQPRTGVPARSVTSTQSLPAQAGVLSSFTSLLGQPVIASIPWLTWGWALLLAAGAFFLLRKN